MGTVGDDRFGSRPSENANFRRLEEAFSHESSKLLHIMTSAFHPRSAGWFLKGCCSHHLNVGARFRTASVDSGLCTD